MDTRKYDYSIESIRKPTLSKESSDFASRRRNSILLPGPVNQSDDKEDNPTGLWKIDIKQHKKRMVQQIVDDCRDPRMQQTLLKSLSNPLTFDANAIVRCIEKVIDRCGEKIYHKLVKSFTDLASKKVFPESSYKIRLESSFKIELRRQLSAPVVKNMVIQELMSKEKRTLGIEKKKSLAHLDKLENHLLTRNFIRKKTIDDIDTQFYKQINTINWGQDFSIDSLNGIQSILIAQAIMIIFMTVRSFSLLSKREQIHLVKNMKILRLNPGNHVMESKEQRSSFYVVISGDASFICDGDAGAPYSRLPEQGNNYFNEKMGEKETLAIKTSSGCECAILGPSAYENAIAKFSNNSQNHSVQNYTLGNHKSTKLVSKDKRLLIAIESPQRFKQHNDFSRKKESNIRHSKEFSEKFLQAEIKRKCNSDRSDEKSLLENIEELNPNNLIKQSNGKQNYDDIQIFPNILKNSFSVNDMALLYMDTKLFESIHMEDAFISPSLPCIMSYVHPPQLNLDNCLLLDSCLREVLPKESSEPANLKKKTNYDVLEIDGVQYASFVENRKNLFSTNRSTTSISLKRRDVSVSELPRVKSKSRMTSLHRASTFINEATILEVELETKLEYENEKSDGLSSADNADSANTLWVTLKAFTKFSQLHSKRKNVRKPTKTTISHNHRKRSSNSISLGFDTLHTHNPMPKDYQDQNSFDNNPTAFSCDSFFQMTEIEGTMVQEETIAETAFPGGSSGIDVSTERKYMETDNPKRERRSKHSLNNTNTVAENIDLKSDAAAPMKVTINRNSMYLMKNDTNKSWDTSFHNLGVMGRNSTIGRSQSTFLSDTINTIATHKAKGNIESDKSYIALKSRMNEFKQTKMPQPIRNDLQVRMENVLSTLEINAKRKLEIVVKYTSPEYAQSLAYAVELWELATNAIIDRENMLVKLHDFEMEASDPRRHFKTLSTNRLTEQKQRKKLRFHLHTHSQCCKNRILKLKSDFSDDVYYKDYLYLDKIKVDYTELLCKLEEDRIDQYREKNFELEKSIINQPICNFDMKASNPSYTPNPPTTGKSQKENSTRRQRGLKSFDKNEKMKQP